MDGAQASCLYLLVRGNREALTSRRALEVVVIGVSLGETASSADLGGSSKYSNENFEDRSGERFHENSSWIWVS